MSWTNLNVNYNVGAVSDNGRIIYCYDSSNCYVSTNTGVSFTSVLPLTNITCIATNGNGSIAIIGASGSELYFTNDTGNTWNIAGIGIYDWVSVSLNNTGKNGIACTDPNTNSAIYTCFNFAVSWGLASSGFYISKAFIVNSTDNALIGIQGLGNNKSLVSGVITEFGWTPYPNQPSSRDWTNIIASADGIVIYACARDVNDFIYRSGDSGNTWTNIGFQALWSCIYCSANGSTVVASINGGRIYTSTNYGGSFVGRENINSWNLIASNADGLILYASTNSSLYNSTDGGISCFAKNTKILMSNNEEVYVQNLKISDIVKTTEGDKKIISIYHSFTYDFSKFKKIVKNSLSYNVPNQDLLLSEGHAIFLGDNYEKYRKKKYNREYYFNSLKINNLNKLLVSDFNLAKDLVINDVEDILENDKLYYYHIILENDNDDGYYAIYSNGLLSESMSLNYYNL